MENRIPVAESTPEQSIGHGKNFPPHPRYGKQSPTPPTVPAVGLAEVIKALAVIQDGLRQLALAGVMIRTPEVNDKGILVMAIKLNGHKLGVGPDGQFTVDGISVMQPRQEQT